MNVHTRMNVQYFSNPYTNFTSMKKSQFEGIDYAVVEKFKAPIEKFNTNSDLQTWAGGKCNDIVHTNYGGRETNTFFQRREEINRWKKELDYDDSKTSAEKLLILDGLTKSLKPDDDTYVSSYNEEVLEKTLNGVKSKINKNKDSKFDFGEIYKQNLIRANMGDENKDKNPVWVHISSRREDRANYPKNVERLKILSSNHWCTKTDHAKDFLKDCDFDIYFEDYAPKIAIKSEEGYIVELEDELNSRSVPEKYKKIVDDYIKSNDMVLSDTAKIYLIG